MVPVICLKVPGTVLDDNVPYDIGKTVLILHCEDSYVCAAIACAIYHSWPSMADSKRASVQEQKDVP